MKKFRKEDTVMLLIDHQIGTLNWSDNRSKEMIVSRTRALARLAKALNIPVVLTSSQENHAQGLLLPDLKEILPVEYEARVKRSGITNAWEDKDYKEAVEKEAKGRKNVIMAGLTHDVCVAYPASAMAKEGYDVQVVLDAGGSPTQVADDIAKETWEKNGARTTTINQLIAELTDSWETEDGQKAMQVVIEEILPTIGKV